MARDTEVPVQAKGLRPAVRKERGAKGQSYILGRLQCEASSYEANSWAVSPLTRHLREAGHGRGAVHMPLQARVSSWVPLRAGDPSHLLGQARAWKSGPTGLSAYWVLQGQVALPGPLPCPPKKG